MHHRQPSFSSPGLRTPGRRRTDGCSASLPGGLFSSLSFLPLSLKLDLGHGERGGDQFQTHWELASLGTRTPIPSFLPQTTNITIRVCIRVPSSSFAWWGHGAPSFSFRVSFGFSQPNPHQLLIRRQNSQGLSMIDKVRTLSWRSRIRERP